MLPWRPRTSSLLLLLAMLCLLKNGNAFNLQPSNLMVRAAKDCATLNDTMERAAARIAEERSYKKDQRLPEQLNAEKIIKFE